MLEKKIKVLIVDDSLLFREVLSMGICSDLNIDVVATASDPYDAIEKIVKFQPDVMTCDVEMPRMNGIEFIKQLMPQHPLPIVVVSSVSDSVFKAMNAGAIDFITKPDIQSAGSVKSFIEHLIVKIKTASTANLKIQKDIKVENIKKVEGGPQKKTKREIIAVGASTGGTEAIFSILTKLPKDIPGVVIVQHIPTVFSRMFADRLDSSLEFHVKEAETGDSIEPGKVFIAPGDKHIRIKKIGDQYKIYCFDDEKVNGHKPSIDILFESVAKEAGNNAIGVILTGMGYDGAKGLLHMRKNGARTIGQDEASSIVYGMPRVAFNIGAVENQVSLDKIPEQIYSMLD